MFANLVESKPEQQEVNFTVVLPLANWVLSDRTLRHYQNLYFGPFL